MTGVKKRHPRRRKQGLTVRELPDETLVYDSNERRALCLNPSAALVFGLCDGETGLERMAEVVRERLAVADAAPLVEHALRELKDAKLLEPAPVKWTPSLSRRELVKRGLKAALMPAVFSLLAPTALSAGSFISAAACTAMANGPTAAPTCQKAKCGNSGVPQKTCHRDPVAPNGGPGRASPCVCA